MFCCLHFFFREKFEVVLFHLQSKFTKKMSKINNFLSSLSIFRGLETIRGNIEKLANFQQMFYSIHVFYREKCEIAMFHLRSQTCSRKCRNVENWKFQPFLRAVKLFGSIEKQSNFQHMFCSIHIFYRQKRDMVLHPPF